MTTLATATVVAHFAKDGKGRVRRHDWGAPVVAYRQAECGACGWKGQAMPGHLPVEAARIAKREADAHRCNAVGRYDQDSPKPQPAR